MPDLFDLPALDSRLLTLLKSRKPLPAFIAAVEQFVTDYESDELGPCALFGKRWRENWRTEERYYGTKIFHIKELEEHARDKLEAVCEGMVRLLEGSHCPRERFNHTKQLKDDLCLYLNCRDPKVGLPGGDEPEFYLPAKKIESIFALSHRQLMAFLSKHQEVERKQPTSSKGTPWSQRLSIHLLDFLRAVLSDATIAGNPAIAKQIENRLKRAQLAEQIENAAMKLFLG